MRACFCHAIELVVVETLRPTAFILVALVMPNWRVRGAWCAWRYDSLCATSPKMSHLLSHGFFIIACARRQVEALGGANTVARALLRDGIIVTVVPPPSFYCTKSPPTGRHELLRLSPHYFNTHAEMDTVVQAVEALSASAGVRPRKA